ncbi:MAG: hypothetical protein SFV81_18955 [Pirellulaceae bacterium]|nr:hypothetical protein [Pirellulaceae bacterium]
MDGIRLLLLLVASAQVEAGTERDYGWQVKDGFLEYIVQINPDKKRAMETLNVENASNMPPQLVGRASRVVVRFGNDILPREPSLQELERTPRLFEPPSVSAAAVLGEDKFRNLEAPVRNIQGQGTTPAFPNIPLPDPSSLAGGSTDRAGEIANTLRDELTERLSDVLPSSNTASSNTANTTVPGRGLPDPGLLAQNLTNQSGAAGSFLDETRGGTSKFNSTAPSANLPSTPAANPPANTPTRIPDYPQSTNANSPFASSNPPSTNMANRNSTLGNAASSTTTPPFPSIGSQTTIPQQRTPSPTFGTTPGLANSTTDWSNTNPSATNYPPAMSQPNDRYNYPAQGNAAQGNAAQGYPTQGYPTQGNPPPGYTSTPNPSGYQNPTLLASNNTPYTPNPVATDNQAALGNPTAGLTGGAGLTRKQLEEALAVQSKFDKNKDGQLTPDEYTPASVDGILLTLFVVSLLVNLYLGHLIRKLLMRYRVVLTNVRSQAAYT